MDQTTNIQTLKNLVRDFCEARDWDRFHGPKDLAIGMVTEASELLEHFRFRDEAESHDRLSATDTRAQIEAELADVLFFVLRFAQRFQIDVTTALRDKVQRNEERYPAEKARGRNAKYTEL
ncbi:MAG: nucleotide pyrophosphohydrolase [Candidatus Binatia bacterium]|jgi:NTP pyrophosphatase (non-canonical NTP hydrolase)